MLTDSPPASPSLEEEDWLVKPIPQSWFPSRQQFGESLPEFQSHPHQHHSTHNDRLHKDLLMFHNFDFYLIMHMAIIHLHRSREILIKDLIQFRRSFGLKKNLPWIYSCWNSTKTYQWIGKSWRDVQQQMDAASFCSCYQSRRMNYIKAISRYS